MRWHTESSIFPIANFALRFFPRTTPLPPFPSLSRSLITDSPSAPCQLCRRAPRFPWRTIRSSAPTSPPFLSPFLSQSPSASPPPSRMPSKPVALCRHNKTWKKRWPTCTQTDVRGERKSKRGDPTSGLVCVWGYPPRDKEGEKSRRWTVLRGYS